MKTKKCICDEMSAKIGFEARTFKCPIHGQVTIDRRLTTPIVIPTPEPVMSQPYTPWYPHWIRPNTTGDFPISPLQPTFIC